MEGIFRRGTLGVALGLVVTTSGFAIDGPIYVSEFGAGNQIWFQAENWDERDPDDATYFEAVVADGALGGLAVTRRGGAGGRLTYIFDLDLGDGVGGPWTMWARVQNPNNSSDYMLVEDDPDDLDIPLGPPPYPGGNGTPPFDNADDRILEATTVGWGWHGNEEGHFKELQDGENIMYIFHRQGDESQLVDLYCWTDDPGYLPTEEDFLNAECVVNCDLCPAEGDTHCLGMTVESVEGDEVEGTYRVTIEAEDDSDDPIFYEVVATTSDPNVTPVTVNSIDENELLLYLTGGTWTITGTVDDDPACDDTAMDMSCTQGPIEVVAKGRPAPETPFWVSNFGGARQIWFRATDWTERLPDTDDFFLSVEQEGSLFGDVMTRAGGAGGCLRYDFDISEAGGAGGEWFMHARVINPENSSDYMLVEGDPGDLIGFPEYDPLVGYPGGDGTAPFDNADDRVFEGTVDDWSWFGGVEGHAKTLHEGLNSMFLFHRQGQPTRVIDIFCWTDSISYDPNDDGFLDAELRNVDCTANQPDTHCQGITITGPQGDETGTYTVTVDAVDDSGDEIIYEVLAEPGNAAILPVTAKSVGNNVLEFLLVPGEWDITVTVDDDPLCEDEAADNSCTLEPITVVPRDALPGPRFSDFEDAIQVWFEAESFTERIPETEEFYPLIDMSVEGAFGDAVSRSGTAGGCILWEFDIEEAGGLGGTWYMWGRIRNPGNTSDYMLVEGDPGDFDIPGDEPYPGGDGVAPFDNATDRVFEGTVPNWGWFGGFQEGHVKELLHGQNLMYIFHREGDPTVFWDVICWTNSDQYVPTDADYADSDLIGEEPRPEFHRGDTDGNGSININDAVAMLNALFAGGGDTSCKETQDFDNDGSIVISDAVGILQFLFGSGSPPAPPGPHTEPCGPDPDPPGSRGDLGCESYTGC